MLQGSFREDGVYVYPLRVYYEDTDAGGIVYHANYLKFAERARSEMLRHLDLHQSEISAGEDGVIFAVRRSNVDYLRPARLDDLLRVETSLTQAKGASFEFRQVIYKEQDVMVSLDIVVACVGKNGRAVRIPGPVRDRMTSHFEKRA